MIKPGDQGTRRAAILLMSLGEQGAADILRHLEPREVQRLGVSMAQLTDIKKQDVLDVLSNFFHDVDNHTALDVGAEKYIRTVLVDALGQKTANGLMDRIVLGSNTKGLEAFRWMDPRAVADLIMQEHPQIIAIVLSYLDAEQSAQVLAKLPERIRVDVIMRIASLDGIPPAAMKELNDIVEKQINTNGNVRSPNVGGAAKAANILNYMAIVAENQILAKISAMDPMLGNEILDNMFLFGDFVDISDDTLTVLLQEVTMDVLVTAIKGADDSLMEKIIRNLPKRTSEQLRKQLQALGAVCASEVEAAQKEILAIMRRLLDSGQISIPGKGEMIYV